MGFPLIYLPLPMGSYFFNPGFSKLFAQVLLTSWRLEAYLSHSKTGCYFDFFFLFQSYADLQSFPKHLWFIIKRPNLLADKLQVFFCILNLILQEDVITVFYFIGNKTGLLSLTIKTHSHNFQAHIVVGSQIIKLTCQAR